MLSLWRPSSTNSFWIWAAGQERPSCQMSVERPCPPADRGRQGRDMDGPDTDSVY